MMPKLFHLVRFHWGGIFAAALCALFIAAPVILFPAYASDNYHGININHFGTDEDFYLARANEVLSGNGLGQPFLAEGKNFTDPTFYNVERVILFPATFFGFASRVNPVTWYNTFNTLGIFILGLLFYALTFALSKNRLLAMTTAVFILGGHSLIFYKTIFYDNFNIYGRSIFPYAASIPFFAFVLLLYKAAVEKRRGFFTLGAGVFLGILFYDYFYAWTFAFAFLVCFFLSSLVSKNWTSAKIIAGVSVIGVVLGLPFLFAFYHFFAGGEGASIAYFLRATHTHRFIMSIIGLATLTLVGLHAWRKPRDSNIPFLLACIGAGWIALEQQIITGRVIEYGHYYWYFIVPFSIIIGIYIVWQFIPERLKLWFAFFFIALALVNTVGGQYQSFFTALPGKMHDQAYGDAMHTLNALPYGVVLTGPGIESFPLLITTYTKNDLYFNPSALVYHTNEERTRESLLAYLALNKEARKNPTGYIEKLLEGTTTSVYLDVYQDIEGYASGLDYTEYMQKSVKKDSTLLKKRAELLSTLKKEYTNKASSPALLRALLIQSGVRYILWDKDFYPEWDLSVLAPLQELSRNENITLYAL